jgi:hypothetical protein
VSDTTGWGIKLFFLAAANLPVFTSRFLNYEAHPQSKFPWGRLQKQNTISWKYLSQQIQQVFSYFSTYFVDVLHI